MTATYTATISTNETFAHDYCTRSGVLRTATYTVTEADGDTVQARVRMGGAWYVATIERTETGITFSRTRENERGSSPYAWNGELTDAMTELFGALFESDDEMSDDVADALRHIEIREEYGRRPVGTASAALALVSGLLADGIEVWNVEAFRTGSGQTKIIAETASGNIVRTVT